MTELAAGRPGLRKPRELHDVHEFLDQVRLRPGMWVRRGSLQHLDSMLVGYAAACEIHDSDESFDFWNSGPFSQWLWKRMNMAYPSNLGWAVENERAAESAGTSPMQNTQVVPSGTAECGWTDRSRTDRQAHEAPRGHG